MTNGPESRPGSAFMATDDLGAANDALKKYIRYGDNSQSTRLQYAQNFLKGGGVSDTGALNVPTELVPAQRRPTPGAYPALSGGAVAGPGILGPTLGPAVSNFDPESTFQRAGAWLQSISNPASLAALDKIGPKAGRYSMQRDEKTGQMLIIDTQTGRVINGGTQPGWKPPDVLEGEKKNAEASAEYMKGLGEHVGTRNQDLARLQRAKEIINDPNSDITFGSGGEALHDFKKLGAQTGLAPYKSQSQAEELASIAKGTLGQQKADEGINRLTQGELFKVVIPGTFGFGNSKEGNNSIIDRRIRETQALSDLHSYLSDAAAKNGGVLKNPQAMAADFLKQRAAQWAAEDASGPATKTTVPSNRPPLGSIFK
jgi:hypothetical protein